MKLPNYDLKPLFDILEGDSALNSPRKLTEARRHALIKVEERLQQAFLKRREEGQPIWLCILPTSGQPTGVLWQSEPLSWIHAHVSPGKSIEYYPTAVASLAFAGLQPCVQSFGVFPQVLVVPYTSNQVQVLAGTINERAVLLCGFRGTIDNHYPRHPLLSFREHPVVFPRITASCPLPGALNIFTDGSKTGCGAYMVEGDEPVIVVFPEASPQVIELSIVMEVFRRINHSFNLISDSNYVVNAVH